MADSLRAQKDRISGRFLGKCGIHGIGIDTKQDAITVHTDREWSEDQEAVFREIAELAAPHQLIVVEEEPPRLS